MTRYLEKSNGGRGKLCSHCRKPGHYKGQCKVVLVVHYKGQCKVLLLLLILLLLVVVVVVIAVVVVVLVVIFISLG